MAATIETKFFGDPPLWKLDTLYKVNEIVEYSSEKYVCILEHTSDGDKLPGTGGGLTYWTKESNQWYDLSTIVFTSSAIDTPYTAGGRSHVFPGGDKPLGLWYESIVEGKMYRVEEAQEETTVDYYNYSVLTAEAFDLCNPSQYLLTTSGSAPSMFYRHVKACVGNSIDYDDVTSFITVDSIRIEYSVGDDIDNIFMCVETGPPDTHILPDYVWEVDVITDLKECWIDFSFNTPMRVKKVSLKANFTWSVADDKYTKLIFIGNYKIQAKLNLEDDWADIYTGSNTNTITADAYMTDNDKFYTYYRLLILNNDSLTSITSPGGTANFDKTKYAVRCLKFYDINYSGEIKLKPFYNFKTEVATDVLYIEDIEGLGGDIYKLKVDAVTGSGTLASGTEISTWGSYTNMLDFRIHNSVVFEMTHGVAYDCWLTAWDDSTHDSTLNPILAGYYCRVSAVAYCAKGSMLYPEEMLLNQGGVGDQINYVTSPVHNKILCGDYINGGGVKYYYGEFDMEYREEGDIFGDFLIFRPMLYGIHSGIPYGDWNFVITLHYSYT